MVRKCFPCRNLSTQKSRFRSTLLRSHTSLHCDTTFGPYSQHKMQQVCADSLWTNSWNEWHFAEQYNAIRKKGYAYVVSSFQAPKCKLSYRGRTRRGCFLGPTPVLKVWATFTYLKRSALSPTLRAIDWQALLPACKTVKNRKMLFWWTIHAVGTYCHFKRKRDFLMPLFTMKDNYCKILQKSFIRDKMAMCTWCHLLASLQQEVSAFPRDLYLFSTCCASQSGEYLVCYSFIQTSYRKSQDGPGVMRWKDLDPSSPEESERDLENAKYPHVKIRQASPNLLVTSPVELLEDW